MLFLSYLSSCKRLISYENKRLAYCIKALSLSLLVIPSATVHSSDIEIYKKAEAGVPTLMFLLDISGSMTGYQVGTDACDPAADSELISRSSLYLDNGTVERPYNRVYCQGQTKATQTNYYYKAEQKYRSFLGLLYTDGSPIYYQCGTTGKSSVIEDCRIVLTRRPSLTGYSSYSTGVTNLVNTFYYYKDEKTSVNIYDRLTKVKDGMFDLLQGSDSITRLSDDKVIGLSAFSYNSDGRRGYVLVPARRLDANVNGQTQRAILLNSIANLDGGGGTPTAHAYAETAAYLMGTTTRNATYSGFANSANDTKSGTNYRKPDSLNTDNASCSGQGIYVLTDGEPNNSSTAFAQNIMRTALADKQSGLTCTSSLFAAGASNSGWLCIADFSQLLLDRNRNPLGREIKTAVVGFGKDFEGIPSYDPGKTEAQNIAAINSAAINNDNVKNAARWGVYSKGGWYFGSNSEDVVNSVNSFINTLNVDIPPVTTGAATVPADNLNPLSLLNTAYFSQFKPTPDQNYQLWKGNLKKYAVTNGVLKAQDGSNVLNNGLVVSNYDYWASGSTDVVGGVEKNLPLRLNLSTNTLNRTIWTDRLVTPQGVTTDETNLRKLDTTLATTTSDPDRGYLLSAAGFAVDLNGLPRNIAQLRTVAELRQMGTLLHSSPILITNRGKVKVNSNKIITEDREDYILFGTTQGLLHVVDAITGIEKFAFLPNEMMRSQKKAFLDYKSTSGGTSNLFYGIDAPWTSYTEYVTRDNKTNQVTVGQGEDSTQGKQYVYGGLRMGGRSYYGLDLANIDQPSMLFHIDPQTQRIYSKNTDVFGALYPELQYMGQSWSKPSIASIRWNNQKRLVMFVGGGYDAGGSDGNGVTDGENKRYEGYESTTYNQTNKRGAGVYMFDAITGELLWWTGANATEENTSDDVKYTTATNMKYSVVSQIRTIDRNLDGLVDHLYFGDLGGQVWRIDLNNDQSSTGLFAKPPVRLLNLTNNQYSPRFYDMPAFSLYRAVNNTLFAALSIGSGNRSTPLFSTTNSSYIDDAIYNIFDRDVTRSDLFATVKKATSSAGESEGYTENALKMVSQDISLSNSNITNKMVPFRTANTSESGGWYYSWRNTTHGLQTNKVIQMPIVVSNDLFVPTFDSAAEGIAGSCGAGVKGQSSVSLFCMPYGKCSGDYTVRTTVIGTGLVSASVTGDSEVDGGTVSGGGSGSRVYLDKTYDRNNKFLLKAWREVN